MCIVKGILQYISSLLPVPNDYDTYQPSKCNLVLLKSDAIFFLVNISLYVTSLLFSSATSYRRRR